MQETIKYLNQDIFELELILNSRKDLIRSLQDKAEQIEKLLPRPAITLEKQIEFKDSIYEGQVKDGLPHGKGTKKWKDGTIYEGEFVEGMMEGTGERKKDGDEYKG